MKFHIVALAAAAVCFMAMWMMCPAGGAEGFAECPAKATHPGEKGLFEHLTSLARAFATKYQNHRITEAMQRGVMFVNPNQFTTQPLTMYNAVCGLMLNPEYETMIKKNMRITKGSDGDDIPLEDLVGIVFLHDMFRTYAELVGPWGSKQHTDAVKLMMKETQLLTNESNSVVVPRPCYPDDMGAKNPNCISNVRVFIPKK